MLPMNVIDAEYQFDRHKLTFYFEADRRIDFRELVRDLFAIYKTRIWLQQVVSVHKKGSTEFQLTK
jgi:cell fate regulator YaaT (PSP1 superfamily)